MSSKIKILIMKICCLPSCKFVGEKGMFNIPSSKDAKKCSLRKIWLQNCNLDEANLPNSPRICYKHFKPTDIKTNGKYITLRKGKIQKFIGIPPRFSLFKYSGLKIR